VNADGRHLVITIFLAISFAFSPVVVASCLGGASSSMEMSGEAPCEGMADREGCKCDCTGTDLTNCQQMCAPAIFDAVASGAVPLPPLAQGVPPDEDVDGFAVAVPLDPAPPKPSIAL